MIRIIEKGSCPVLTEVKGQTSVIIQIDPSISIKGSLPLSKGRPNNGAHGLKQASHT